MAARVPEPVHGYAAFYLPEEARRPSEIAVADLHLGLGYLEGAGPRLAEESARAMAEELLRAARVSGAQGIIVVGDSKHPIVGAPAPIGKIVFDFFSTLLGEQLGVTVVLGNHDVGLVRHLPKEVEVHTSLGLRRGTFGLFHGHRWPTPRVLRARTLLAGHLHPGYRLAAGRSDAGGKQRCWVRVELAAPKSRRKSKHRIDAKELIVLPAFNPLSGIESLNKGPPAEGRTFLVHRFLAPGSARAYLLDGTDLGQLPSWAATRPRPTRPKLP